MIWVGRALRQIDFNPALQKGPCAGLYCSYLRLASLKTVR